MIDTLAVAPEAEADDLNASALLASIRSERDTENAAAARQLDLAARWADLHPPESIHLAAAFTTPGFEHEEPIAGDGCPLVAEFCIAELGAVLGISTTAAKKLIGHALELRHRLPRLWRQVHAGRVPAWRARSVAETTIHAVPSLTREAAGWVDSQVAAVAGKIGVAQLDRLVAEAIKRFELASPDPASDPEDGYLHVDPRHVTVHDQEVHYAGTLHIEAEVDLADGLDLNQAIAHGAAARKAAGSTETLDVRRAKALGDLARTQTALDLFAQDGGFEARSARTSTTDSGGPDLPDLPPAREVVLHAHFDATFSGDATIFTKIGQMENRQKLLMLEQLQSWCADTRTKITVKPVIDLNRNLSAPGYTVPARIREHVILRDKTCVFPHCTRPARGCDIDHVIPYDHDADAEGREQPGPTSTDNLAALCRQHHRLKTHSAWRYEMHEPGVFEWTSPHGHRFRRDRSGTIRIDQPPD
jgi:5-methylcytosine-specific restriction endonuclease McrA